MMNPRVILALTVPIVLVLVIIGAILADGSPNDGALDIADELIGVIGVILGGIVSGILVSGNGDKNKDDNDDVS